MRLFAAVVPPPPIVEVLRQLPRPEQQGVRWTKPEHWHVTLRFFGDVPLVQVPAVVEALSNLDVPPTTAHMHGPAGLFGPRLLQLPVVGLDVLATVVRDATTPLLGPPDKPFTGHLTLARSKGPSLKGLTDVEIEERWNVEEVLLFSSTLTAEGAIHERIADLPIA